MAAQTIELKDGGILLYDEHFLPPQLADQSGKLKRSRRNEVSQFNETTHWATLHYVVPSFSVNSLIVEKDTDFFWTSKTGDCGLPAVAKKCWKRFR